MTTTYFSNFPIINYSNTLIRDISRRCTLPESLRSVVTAFYPYDLTYDQRSDVLSYNYYGDSDADWLIYLTNGIIDPYYGWYLDNDQFSSLLIDKYGSLTDPQERIAYWQTNWASTDENVTTSYYNALPVTSQKYYMPIWAPSNQIVYYQRRQEDWSMNTNQIWSVGVANSAIFSSRDLVVSNTITSFIEGQGEVISTDVDNNLVYIKDIANNFTVGSQLQLLFNNAITSTISNTSIVQINISLSEAVYWSPITYFEYEKGINEQNKSLLLLDKSYLNQAVTTFQKNINQ